MRSTILLLALCAAVAFAAVVPSKEDVKARVQQRLEKLKQKKEVLAPSLAGKSNGFAYAVDLISSGSQSTFNCLYNSGNNLVFLRIYNANNNGGVDTTGVNNVYYAVNAGLGYEVFFTPATNNVKSGGSQFTEGYNYAIGQGLRLNRVWLQVTSPVNWGTSTSQNINLIKSFISTASSYGINVGIYTNWYDWQQITGGTSSISNIYALWYWNANGVGSSGETAQNANDFVPFGPFSSAMIKQYGIGESQCSVSVNKNIYATSTALTANSVDKSSRKA
ncbi:hypothetical protein M3Y97_00606700 [Aphelenchoides bicaudatus]|nr:hypothetical protein M3Y97_00606700 [Aphelenchoides bicaudatus]